MMKIDKYYRALGITGNEDIRVIKKIYMKVAQKYHPDKNQNSADSIEKFIDAKDAYENIIKFRKDLS
jgi:DnaJ-class molecular chaperone